MAANRRRLRAPVEPGPRKGRILLISVLLALVFGALIVRAWHLQVFQNEAFRDDAEGNHLTTITLRAPRGAIYDRDGRELALTAMVPSVYAVPRAMTQPTEAARRLAALLDTDEAILRRRLSSGKAFVWLQRRISPTVARQVEALGIEGVALRDEPRRFYPNRSLAGPILGFAGIDGEGLEGVERDFDRYLKGHEFVVDAIRDSSGRKAMPGGSLPMEQLSGHALTLSIDARIQQVAESTLHAQVAEVKAKGGVVVVLDPRTGDILALAQTPVFDPNLFQQAEPADWRNRVITDVLEPGSTIKPLLIAAALDLGKVRPDTMWDGFYGKLKVGRKIVRDVHGAKEMTTLEIIQHSSNVGAVQVGQRIGKDAYYSYLKAFGFGEPTGLGLRGEQDGTLRPASKWGLIHLATHSYGYGLSVTPLQMARAMSAVANKGVLMSPRLALRVTDAKGEVIEDFPARIQRRVISEKAARDTTEGLFMVTQKGGTGRRARVAGYKVAGKTGTAHKVDRLARGYSHDKVTGSFVGFVPADDPRLVIYVAIDEPQTAHYGGVVAAPVFAKIAREALPYMGVEATEDYDSVDEEEEDDLFAEGLEPSARPWWYEEGLLTGAPSHLVVPDLRGQPLAAVLAKTAGMDVELEIEGAGLVVKQRPQPNALLPRNAKLAIVLAQPGAFELEGEGEP